MEVGPLVNCKTTKQKLKIHELGSWLQPGYVLFITLFLYKLTSLRQCHNKNDDEGNHTFANNIFRVLCF